MKNRFWTLFSSTFMLSACTFGGGFVIVPLMRKKFVQELGWIDEQEMLDLTAIAQSSPGAIAVNASILVGYRAAGVPGALLAILGTVLPPLVIISVISLFYQQFRDNALVSAAMAGMLAGVAAVIADVVISMTGQLVKRKSAVTMLTLFAAFVAARYLDVSIIVIILVSGAVGVAQWLAARRKGDET